MKVLALLGVLVAAVLADDHFSYEGYQVYTVIPTTRDHAEFLKGIQESGEFDFWSNAKVLGQPINIMVKPELVTVFSKMLTLKNINHSVLIENVELTVQAERAQQIRAPKVEKGKISFTEYHRYEVIQEYLRSLGEKYPDKAHVSSFGESSEGRPLTSIQIGTDPGKPTIVMDAGIHAREWIAPATALYIIQQLVENEEYAYLSENINWLIVPVLNPDGYEYSHTNTRMWRKTRSRGNVCYGVDGNRNFGFMWGGLGTSDNECSEIYRGPNAFSEPEIAAFRDLVLQLDSVPLYIALHSYGSWVLYPWGYDYILSDNNDELHSLGENIAGAIYDVSGTRFTVGNAAFLLYPAAGASDDWMKSIIAPLSFTLELPGGGSQGFDLPPYRITEVVTETWQGILAAYKYISDN
ncbi:carboxypeptidase B1 [Onthophagus taurus]|uniref:carboxypeptidase B1 n=1 Tax=Onthophagus taurus TaxID=166361 RepID=UPI0039BE8D2C